MVKENLSRREMIKKTFAAAVVGAFLHEKAEAQIEQGPARPPIEKKSPQRTAYNSRENYEKYAASFDLQSKNDKPVKKKDLTDKEIREMKEKIDKAFENADKQREWLADIVYSPEYEKRCLKEGLTIEQIKARREIVLKTEPVMTDEFNSLPKHIGGLYYDTGKCVVSLEIMKKKDQYDGPVVTHGFTHTLDEIWEGSNTKYDGPVVTHELTHALQNMDKGMSKTAKDMYLKAFAPNLRETRWYLPADYLKNAHLTDPAELDARKTEFEYELEKLNVWKYGETFTKEHLKEALRLQGGRKLSLGSEDFLLYLGAKKNVDLFIKIMNTLA